MPKAKGKGSTQDATLFSVCCRRNKKTVNFQIQHSFSQNSSKRFTENFWLNDQNQVLEFELKRHRNRDYDYDDFHHYTLKQISKKNLTLKVRIFYLEGKLEHDLVAGVTLTFTRQQRELNLPYISTSSENTFVFKFELSQLELDIFDTSCVQHDVLENPKEKSSLVANFAKVYDAGDHDLPFSDIIISCGSGSFSCNKFVLAARSSVFAAMFDNPMKESEENLVKIDDVEATVFEKFLRFIYTDQIKNMGFEDALLLLPLADRYNVEKLMSVCEDIICENMDLSNAVETVYMAYIHNAKNILSLGINFIATNLKILIGEKAFQEVMMKHPEIQMKVLQRVAESRNL